MTSRLLDPIDPFAPAERLAALYRQAYTEPVLLAPSDEPTPYGLLPCGLPQRWRELEAIERRLAVLVGEDATLMALASHAGRRGVPTSFAKPDTRSRPASGRRSTCDGLDDVIDVEARELPREPAAGD
ncbi:MAG TPA: hypothetical protein VLJ86_00750 [Ramlibacter sp.]|nr:hypothetical protein [Ramlibacter sp.]